MFNVPSYTTIYRSALPLSFAVLAYGFMNMISMMMLGQYGVEDLAAGLLGVQLNIFIYYVSVAFIAGFGPIFGNYIEKSDIRQCQILYEQMIIIALIAGCAGFTIMFFGKNILIFFNQSPILAQKANYFMLFLGLGSFANMIFSLIWEVLVYNQRFLIVWQATILQLLCNIIFNYCLIYGVGDIIAPMGLTGAGLGSFLAALTSAIYGYVRAVKFGYIRLRIDIMPIKKWWHIVKAPIKLGIPMGLEQAIGFGSVLIMTFLIGRNSDIIIAAHAVAFEIIDIFIIFSLGFGYYTTIYISSNFEKISYNELLKIALRVNNAILIPIIILFFLIAVFYDNVVVWFVDKNDANLQEIIAISFSFYLIGMGLIVNIYRNILGGALHGYKIVYRPLVASLIGSFGIGIFTSLILIAAIPNFIQAPWVGFLVGEFANAIFYSQMLRQLSKKNQFNP